MKPILLVALIDGVVVCSDQLGDSVASLLTPEVCKWNHIGLPSCAWVLWVEKGLVCNGCPRNGAGPKEKVIAQTIATMALLLLLG